MILARPLAAPLPEAFDLAGRRLGLAPDERAAVAAQTARHYLMVTGATDEDLALLTRREGARAGRAPGTALVAGTGDELAALASLARGRGLADLAEAISRALRVGEPPATMLIGGTPFEFGRRTFVMGVINVTPDSFSDGGRFADPAVAISHGEQLAAAGADLLDVGGESTRPGAPRVSIEEELARVLPVIRGLKGRTRVPLSVDTTKAAVAREALAAGASMVNDISGFSFDPNLPRVVADAGAACCLMHIQGTCETMQKAPHYGDAMAEIIEYLAAAVNRAARAGIPRARLMVNPGIGFGKTFGHNLFLLRRLRDLRVLGLPVVVGPSRKAFLGQIIGGKPPAERVVATAACAAAIALASAADFVRVHDVPEVCDAVEVAEAMRSATEGGDLFLNGNGRKP